MNKLIIAAGRSATTGGKRRNCSRRICRSMFMLVLVNPNIANRTKLMKVYMPRKAKRKLTQEYISSIIIKI
jgi:hypothetical protein